MSSPADGHDAGPVTLTADSLALASSALLALQSSAAGCDDQMIARLEANSVTSASHVTADVSIMIDCLSDCVPLFVTRARQHCKRSYKLLEAKEEEVDADVKTLLSFLPQLTLAGDDTLEFTDDTFAVITQFLRSISGFTDVPCALTPTHSDALHVVSTSSRVSIGFDAARSNVSLPPWFTRDRSNIVRVTVVDSANEPVYGVTPADVVTSFDEGALGWSVSSVTVDANIVTLLVVPAADCTATASLRADIGGSLFTIPLETSRTWRYTRSHIFAQLPFAGSAMLARVAPDTLGTFLTLMRDWLPDARKPEMLFRMTRDGTSTSDFHSRCDGKGPTVVLILSTNGFVFGGYADKSWEGGEWHFIACDKSFVLTVWNPHGIPPTRYLLNDPARALCGSASCGPRFGLNSIVVGGWGSLTSGCCTPFIGYSDTTGKGADTFTGAYHFTPAEVEVWRV